MQYLFEKVAGPVATTMTVGAKIVGLNVMAIDGTEFDVPDTPLNAAEFGYSGSGANRSAFPKVRMVTVTEAVSHAPVLAEIGPISTGEATLAAQMWPQLDPQWLLTADRNFYSFAAWSEATATGASLLWRAPTALRLPKIRTLLDGTYLAVIVDPSLRGSRRDRVIAAVTAGQDYDPALAHVVRVVEYNVPDRTGSGTGELIALLCSITEPVVAEDLAEAYHRRWEVETAFKQLKTQLRGPGRILRSESPTGVIAEIYGYLLTHWAISDLMCRAATEAQIDPNRMKFAATVQIIRRRVSDSPAFPPSAPGTGSPNT